VKRGRVYFCQLWPIWGDLATLNVRKVQRAIFSLNASKIEEIEKLSITKNKTLKIYVNSLEIKIY